MYKYFENLGNSPEKYLIYNVGIVSPSPSILSRTLVVELCKLRIIKL